MVTDTAAKVGGVAIASYGGQIVDAIGRWDPKSQFLADLLRQVQPVVIQNVIQPTEEVFVDLVHRTHDFLVEELRKVLPEGTKLPVLK